MIFLLINELDGGRSKPPSRCLFSRSFSRFGVSTVENGLYMILLEGDLELNTAVLLTSCRSLVVCNRNIRSVALGGHPLERNALADQVVTYSVGTVIGQTFVALVAAGVIRMAWHLNDIVAVLNEDRGNLVK